MLYRLALAGEWNGELAVVLSLIYGAGVLAPLMVLWSGQFWFYIMLSPVLIRLPKIPAREHVHKCPPPHGVVLHTGDLTFTGNLKVSSVNYPEHGTVKNSVNTHYHIFILRAHEVACYSCSHTFTLPCRCDLLALLWVTNTTPQSATAADAPSSTKRSGQTMPLANEKPHERPKTSCTASTSARGSTRRAWSELKLQEFRKIAAQNTQ